MDLSNISTNPSDPPSFQDDHQITFEDEDHEATCWGCGLRLVISPYAPVFKCGWCGAITNHKVTQYDYNIFWWRRFRDRCFVGVLILFILFIICGGIWAVFPVVFSTSYIYGFVHFNIAVILIVSTVSFFSLAAFTSAGSPPNIEWGSYPAVGKGGLRNYTFCNYCSKPKSPRTHHCRSCGKCVLDMDHHCPFIGNCVGADNHRHFIIFLISAILSNIYVTIMSAYTAHLIWPPVRDVPISMVKMFGNYNMAFRVVKDLFISFLSSMVFLPARGLVLIYLFIASISVEMGLSVLLWQQLSYIYEGKTYLGHLTASENEDIGEKDCQNLNRFFGCSYTMTRYFPSFWNSRKRHAR
ncbi:protein modifying enzyme [Lithospermum erythrorhizon]|uniref:S-acyltransferase n=1 Tax=Lithospermum erythrorhizon TaxID=34254 RepID=A0AAV3RPQ0_LITER